MVIQLKHTKNYIKIIGSSIISAKYKCDLIKNLNLKFELKTSENVAIRDDLFVNEITKQDEDNYLDCYKEGDFNCSFEDFLELVAFPFSKLKIYLYGSNANIATIDFEPDGDIDTIWIDILNSEYLQDLLEVIRKTNA